MNFHDDRSGATRSNDNPGEVRKNLWYVLPVIVGQMLPFATLPFILRALAAEEYGRWVLCYAYALFVSGIANFGMPIVYERNFFESQDSQGHGERLFTTLGFTLCLSSVCLVLTAIFRENLATLVTSHPKDGVLLLATTGATLVASFKTYYALYLRNTGNARAYTVYTLDETILGAALTVIFVVAMRVGSLGLAWGPLIASTAVLILVSRRVTRELPVHWSTAYLYDALKMGAPLAPRLLIGVVATQFDKFLLGRLASVGSVAVYSVGQRLAHVVFTYMTALENSFVPEVYRRMFKLREEGAKSVGRYLTPYAVVSVGVALLVVLFSEEVLKIIAPSGYGPAQAVVSVLAIHYALMFFGKLPTHTYAKKTWTASAISVVTVFLTVVLCFLFVAWFGFIGAAWATLAAGAASIFMFVAIGQRYYRIEFEWWKLFLAYGFLTTAALGNLAIQEIGMSYGVRLSLKLVCVLVYAGIGSAAIRSVVPVKRLGGRSK